MRPCDAIGAEDGGRLRYGLNLTWSVYKVKSNIILLHSFIQFYIFKYFIYDLKSIKKVITCMGMMSSLYYYDNKQEWFKHGLLVETMRWQVHRAWVMCAKDHVC